MLNRIKEFIVSLFTHEVNHIEEVSNDYSNHNKTWTNAELEYLAKLVNDGVNDIDIATVLGRTENSVYIKKRKLYRDGVLK